MDDRLIWTGIWSILTVEEFRESLRDKEQPMYQRALSAEASMGFIGFVLGITSEYDERYRKVMIEFDNLDNALLFKLSN